MIHRLHLPFKFSLNMVKIKHKRFIGIEPDLLQAIARGEIQNVTPKKDPDPRHRQCPSQR
jgi:hypothetical protein